jgi:hypothetical protein
MQIKTCQPGGVLRLPPDTRLMYHRRQGDRIVLGAFATPGTGLILGGALIAPITGTPGLWSYLFSLHATRCFTLGRCEVHIWLPGELLPHAAACEDWLHVGVVGREDGGRSKPLFDLKASPPAPVASVSPCCGPSTGAGFLLRSA